MMGTIVRSGEGGVSCRFCNMQIMEVQFHLRHRAANSSTLLPFSTNSVKKYSNSLVSLRVVGNRRVRTRIAAILRDVPAAVDPGQVGVTWQIVVGAIAGVTPFVVAGIEFSKRIIAQRRCEECGGSGLVLRGKDYFRCPGCGGFLPWQSWRRFFSG